MGNGVSVDPGQMAVGMADTATDYSQSVRGQNLSWAKQRADYSYQKLLQDKQEEQYARALAFQEAQFNRAVEAQNLYRDQNLRVMRNVADEAGVPLYQVLSGRVPSVTNQLFGSNFRTLPAGMNPFTYNNFTPSPNLAPMLASPASRITTGGGTDADSQTLLTPNMDTKRNAFENASLPPSAFAAKYQTSQPSTIGQAIMSQQAQFAAEYARRVAENSEGVFRP